MPSPRPSSPASSADRTFTGSDPVRELAVDRVQRAPLDVALDPPEVLADEGQDEALHAEDEDHAHAAEERAREVRIADPVHDAVDPECERSRRAEHAERDPDPLDRLGPDPAQHMQGEPRQSQGRVAGPAHPRRM